jgi:hypothetical protein
VGEPISYEDRLAVHAGLRSGRRERPVRSGRSVWSAVVVACTATALLVVGVLSTADTVLLAARGEVTGGTVVAVHYGSRADFVDVRLDPPVDRQVRLYAWEGQPMVGTVLRVRYDRGDPNRAADARAWVPWTGLLVGFGGGGLLAVGSWRAWSGGGWSGRGRRRRERRSGG